MRVSRCAMAVAISIALATSLSACSGGGGGGNVRPTQPATPPPVAPPPSPPPAPTYAYPQYSQLVPTGALAAQKAGFTGQGVKVGVLDSGVDTSLAPLANSVTSFKSYVTGGSNTPNDTDGHGSGIAMLIGGQATSGYVGGVAPGASLYYAQVCSSAGSCIEPPQAYADLTAQGVRLFNQSFGFAYNPTDTGTINYQGQQMAAEYQSMVAAGNLFVWAAGNDGASKLDFEAAVPAYQASLQKGWLAVVNVQVDSNGNPTTLDSTSGACGIAEMWCLAAPGTTYVLPVPGTAYTSGFSDGTSNSTAIVTGIAAQVWQAFPWMSGTDVQQTLLTTATPLGGSTPNTTYGWGMVNAAKAVNGPAQFAFGTFDADVSTYNSTFSNAISGSGSLALTGTTGTLTLSAANTYSGGTTVNGATLAITGSVASDINVVGGVLTGNGTINGKVINAGGSVISTGTASGQGLSVAGNYTAQPSATTAVSLGNPLKVGGTATAGGTLEILSPATTYTPSSTETLLTAGSLTGTFAKQTYGTGVFYSVSGLTYGPNALTASVTRQAVQQSIPLSAATFNVAQGLDTALNLADQWSSSPTSYAAHSVFLGTAAQLLTARTQSAAIASVGSLNGEIYGTSNAIEAQQSQVTDDALAIRQNNLSAGAKPGVWVQALGSAGGLAQSSFASVHYQMGGALVGIDTPIIGNVSGGAAFGHASMNANLSGMAGHTNGRADTFALYAKALFDNGSYLAGRVSWTKDRMDVRRTALLGSTLYTITGNSSDHLVRATLEAGKAFTVDQNTITPYLSVTGLRLDTHGLTEIGAGGFGLTVANQSHNAAFATLGARFGHSFTWAGGQSGLTGYLAWRRTLSGLNLDMTAAFAGALGSDFEAIGQGLVRNTGAIGVNVSTKINDCWNWYINVDAQGSHGRSHNVTTNAGIEFKF